MIEQLKKVRLRVVFWVILFFFISCIIQLNLAVSLFLVFLAAYFKSRRLAPKNATLLNLALLVLISFTISSFVIKQGLSIFFIPFCSIPLLTTLLFNNPELSLLVTLASSICAGSIYQFPLPLTLLFFVSGMSSSLLALGARKRITIIHTGIAAGFIQLLSLILVGRVMPRGDWTVYSASFVNGLISCIIVLGVLPVFEYLFKATTNISLLELADFHHPLLQRMIQEAPGTFHHSLIVGNLSESACRAIGANALLSRIGAYYHDIGKLKKPEYFSENQACLPSKHNALSPTMSRLIIMNHVKEGAELAKKYKLAQPLIDFILQHHGNSLVFYFYRRALESLEEEEIKEEGFRYPGPRPNNKETAIVLLADSVEAATRALKEPDPEKIKEAVHKVINNKFIDRQLDECELSLKDLEKISEVFIRILSGIYHSRISYPEPKIENNHKKLSKEDPHQSEKDKSGNS